MTIEINPLFAVGPVPECHLTCKNGGYCTFKSSDDGTLFEIFASGGMIQHCVCPPGYAGLACENVVEQCHDLTCHNGMPCSLVGDEYVCDCSDADAVSSFAGAMCREPSTTYCGQGDIQNRGFCTNGGLCKANLKVDSEQAQSDYSTHKGCHCPPEFEGPHCEYLRGMTQDAFEELHLKTSFNEKVVPTSNLKSSLDNIVPTSQTNESTEAKAEMPSILSATNGNGDADMSTQNFDIFASAGIFVGIAMTLFSVAFLAKHQRRSRRKRYHTDLLDRAAYIDETPIQIRVMGELESPTGDDGYVDEEDLHSISECSLEEIELDDNSIADNYREYLQHIRDDGFQTHFDNAPDFTNIIGPLINMHQTHNDQ